MEASSLAQISAFLEPFFIREFSLVPVIYGSVVDLSLLIAVCLIRGRFNSAQISPLALLVGLTLSFYFFLSI